MKKYEFCIHRFYLRSLTILYRCLPVFLLILVIIFLLACAEKRMTIDEAKKVTVSLVKEPFVSPPRRIDDILAILDQPGQFDSEIVSKTKAIADASPPETDNYAVLANFYLKRGLNARELGRSNQVFQDIHIAFKYAKKSRSRNLIKIPKEDYARIMTELGQEEAYLGNFKQGISLMEKGLDIHKRMGGNPFLSLGLLYFMAGDYNAGKAAFEEGIRLYNQRIRPGRRGYRGGIINRSFLRAELLKKEGNFAEEELVRRSLLKQMKQSGDWIKNHPRTYIYVRSWLAQNLAKQGRPIEAELEARRALNAALGYAGKESAVTARVVGELGKIMLSQKRLIDAEKLAIARTEIYEAAGASTNSLLKGEAIKLWCQVAMARLDYAEAMKRFEIAKETFLDNHYVYERFFKRDPDFILCLLKTGRFEEAIKSITSVYKEYRQFFGDNSYPSAEMLSLQGIASAMMGMTQEAMKYFSESVPILLKEKTATEGDYLKNQRLMIILEAYLDLLTGIHGDKFEKEFGVDASAESFKLVQIMIKSSVQSALGASGAREAAIDPELIGLVRREQDSLKQINALQAMLSNAIAMPPDQQRPDALKDLTARIDALSRARIILIDEIKRRFPKYSDFTDPQPVTFIQVQKHLRQGEVLISIYSTDSRTYVWAIPPSGEVIFSAVGTGKKKLRKIISKLRKALDPEPTVLGDIPEFNIALAYDLYSELLKPVEKGWENATDLLIVAHGPLGQIPFSILPTAPVDSGENEQELFGKYKKVPWLIRKASVTRLPSASTL